MKFKNISKRTKHLKIDGTWLSVLPGQEFEVFRTLGRLHLDPELEKVEKKKSKTEEKEEVAEEKKDTVDVSELDEKSKARVKDLKDDLKDDGKRNRSNKKAKSKSKPKKK